MSPIVDLVIRTPFAGAEEKFEEACKAREQHWAGRAGLGNVRPESRLDEILTRNAPRFAEALIVREGWGPEDFDHAAAKFASVDDEGMRTLGRHMRAAADEIRRAEVEIQMSRAEEAEDGDGYEHGVFPPGARRADGTARQRARLT